MIIRNQEARPREFKGIHFDVLVVGERTMLTRMKFAAGDRVPAHRHPNEQSGYIVSGRIRIICPEFDEVLEPGDSYSVPADMEHHAEALADTVVLDFFTPPREDYR